VWPGMVLPLLKRTPPLGFEKDAKEIKRLTIW
jgi:hypothetical protein